uniref:UDP-4-amino-4, 6-dideoxy-N-acetyl-beta-L-altrosamine transaminase n=1 Tax=OCS116 cluster bacterium TaxID=2030921 RepID=A0A2A4YU90_9PROT
MAFIPYSRPEIGEAEIAEVIDTLKSGWLTTGPKTKQFEDDFAEFVQAKFALGVNSATAGLHLALEALGVTKADYVITTVHTFTASAEIIRYLGATPLFADIEADSYCICPKSVEKLLAQYDNVKVVIPVHYAGQICDMDALLALQHIYDFKLLEDAAHALPATYNGKMVGTISDVTVFSFYANKTITTGEGGMVTTNDETIANRIKIMRLHGIDKDAFYRFQSDKPSWHYEVVAPGYKYNLTDIASSIGIHQLKKAHQFRKKRQKIAEIYNQAFADLPVICPKPRNSNDLHAWHIYCLQIDTDKLNISRAEFIERLSQKGVGCSVHYIPLHQHPYWQQEFNLTDEDFPISTRISSRHLSLPNFPGMTDDEITHVANMVCEVALEAIK